MEYRMYKNIKHSNNSKNKSCTHSLLSIFTKVKTKNKYRMTIEYLKQNNKCARENFETILKLDKSTTS
ncbi:MAG: hypothetical protein V8R01_00930 [Bacilli bacterium]